MATVDEFIKQLQEIKRERLKELKEANPDTDIKELKKRAGQLSVVQDCGYGRKGVEEVYIDYKLINVYYGSGDYYYRAAKIYTEGEY